MSLPTLEEMEDRANRQLDGMTVNRDAMARDVLHLVKAIRGMQKRASESNKTNKYPDDFFNGIFGGNPWSR